MKLNISTEREFKDSAEFGDYLASMVEKQVMSSEQAIELFNCHALTLTVHYPGEVVKTKYTLTDGG